MDAIPTARYRDFLIMEEMSKHEKPDGKKIDLRIDAVSARRARKNESIRQNFRLKLMRASENRK